LLAGISLRAVQLNLQPDQWARTAMFVTTIAIVIQAIAVPLLSCFVLSDSGAELGEGTEDSCCTPARKADEESRWIPMCILSICWSLLMACLYVGIVGTLVTVFAMEAEPLEVVWPEKQIGLLENFLHHLEKSRHLMKSEALHALSSASIPPISTAMRCTMLLTVLYFGVFLGVLVGRAMCGAARKHATQVTESFLELGEAEQTLREVVQGLENETREREKQAPELVDVVVGQKESRDPKMLQDDVQRIKEELQERRGLLGRAQASEAQVREGAQRSLAFVPMLCVIMISVRMRAMQVHIRDPQPWAQITMYVATSAVTTQVVASILWACFVRADDVALSCGEVGLIGKVVAIIILAIRYVAAIALYIAMIALVVALFSMSQSAQGMADLWSSF